MHNARHKSLQRNPALTNRERTTRTRTGDFPTDANMSGEVPPTKQAIGAT
eukprot:CAMPEP_0204352920 /NCGR_PEP_ID=MMETSP0469-20131031/32271_1 /ASSEMBLY_ACC=CAM_ASM_000384 /TAXON_ID=2969 /ORGANISM="Oxyrrhis marina" /LENGTH=49 /DNA_ID= /DNA_START= /DNA_END= /DNA_ORIENTATION=